VETEVTNYNGPNGLPYCNFGVMCRVQRNVRDPGGYYNFWVACDGEHQISKWLPDGGAIWLSDAKEASNPIRAGESARVVAECIGPQLIFWINDVLVAEAYDTQFKQGDVGFSTGWWWAVDYFRVYKP